MFPENFLEQIRMASLSVIIPAYNEQSTIGPVLRKVLGVPYLHEVIVVDDCSSDRTSEICAQFAARYSEVRVIRHPRNQGKTAALRTGFAASTGDIVIVQDADLEYDPAEIVDVIRPIADGVADVVYGSRFLVRKAARVLYYYHFLANKFISFLSNLFTNINLTDVETGYKAFRGDIIRNMIISSRRFGFEIEVTAKVAKIGCAIYEVPISYYGRTYEEGKKITAMDGIAAVWQIIKYNLFCSLKQSFLVVPSGRSLTKVRSTNASGA
ncbi:MAG: glycosyltransferase family 2 protein [Acidobacteriaceae bacterium]|nr:glycosyltransferase family 2 protein [Acidobacteriaceae bacterium]